MSTPDSMHTIRIGDRLVGGNAPVFIIAEAGVNHNGCVETALHMVDIAAKAGADAVKFQAFKAEQLVTPSAKLAQYQTKAIGAQSQIEMLSELELSPAEMAMLKLRCDDQSIIFLATPFGATDIPPLLDIGVAAIKIASTDLTNSPLLEAAAATNLPVIVSTGASTATEIEAAVDFLRRWGADERLILLHCVSCYPTSLNDINLGAINNLANTFNVFCGLSDHTLAPQTGGWAVAAGAIVLEKHFTLDRTWRGPDHAMSLEPGLLGEYVALARQAQRSLGNGEYGMTPKESEVRAVARKSVVTCTAIEAGATITGDLLTLKRPGLGISPNDLGRILGRVASVHIPPDTAISWDMLQ